MKNKIALALLKYLRFFAKAQLLKNKNAKIIGITGTAGKSSVRNTINSVLGPKNKVKISYKANSESGIPLNILNIDLKGYSVTNWLKVAILAPIKLVTNWEKFDYYIVEMGIDSPNSPKNMEYLLTIVKPQISIFLNAGLGHSLPFDHLVSEKNPAKREELVIEEIAKEKAKIVRQLDENGFAILNFDDKNVKKFGKNSKAQICSIGKNKSNDISLLDWKINWTEKKPVTIFKFQIQKSFGNLGKTIKNQKNLNEILEIKISDYLLAQHFSYSLAAAIIIGLQAGISTTEIKNRLEKSLELPAGRSSLIEGINNSLILDSSYNASSFLDMIDLIEEIELVEKKDKKRQKSRKIALLGDFRELGKEEEKAHQEIAKKAALRFDIIYLVGPLMRKYALPIIKNKIYTRVEELASFDNSKKAGQNLKEIIEKNDLILVKGSQNTIYLEEAISKILRKKEDQDKLCRQDAVWKKTKESYFSNLKSQA